MLSILEAPMKLTIGCYACRSEYVRTFDRQTGEVVSTSGQPCPHTAEIEVEHGVAERLAWFKNRAEEKNG